MDWQKLAYDVAVNDRIHVQVWCRLISFLKIYLTSANYFWMFCEGFHLHRLISNAFETNTSTVLLHLIGWRQSLFYEQFTSLLSRIGARKELISGSAVGCGATNHCIGLSAVIGVRDIGNHLQPSDLTSFVVRWFPVANGTLFVQKYWKSEI